MKPKKSPPKRSPKKTPEGPGKKNTLAGGDVIRIRQRTKVDPVAAEGFVDPDGGHGPLGKAPHKIRLMISTSPEGWDILRDFAESDKEGLAQEVLRFVYAATAKTEPAPAHKDEFIEAIKRDSRALYGWLRYWIHKEPAKRPGRFEKFVSFVEAKGGNSGIHAGWQTQAVLVDMTMCCMKTMYEQTLSGLSLRPFGNAKSFYITYIAANSPLPSVDLDGRVEHAAVPMVRRAMEMRVKRIFRSLGILPPR